MSKSINVRKLTALLNKNRELKEHALNVARLVSKLLKQSPDLAGGL